MCVVVVVVVVGVGGLSLYFFLPFKAHFSCTYYIVRTHIRSKAQAL